MKDYARDFYFSQAWKKTREAYRKSRRNLCEVCLEKGLVVPCVIVHHKTPITPENINDPNITLSWNNLQCVCRECHAQLHDQKDRRYTIDEYGRVIFPPDTPLVENGSE